MKTYSIKAHLQHIICCSRESPCAEAANFANVGMQINPFHLEKKRRFTGGHSLCSVSNKINDYYSVAT